MEDGLIGYGQSAGIPVPPEMNMLSKRLSTVDRLHLEKKQLEDRLTTVNEAINALKANPEFEKLLHLVSKCF
jgi:pantoate kinase